MSNLLLSSGSWSDDWDNTPPACWNESAYAWTPDLQVYFKIKYSGGYSGSDTCAASVSWNLPDIWEANYGWFLNYVSGETGAVVQSLALTEETGTASFSYQAAGGYFSLDNYADGSSNGTPEVGAGYYLTITPTADATGPTASFTDEVTAGSLTVPFTDTSTAGDYEITGWAWDFGDGSGTSSEQNPSYTYGAAGTYTVTLTVTDSAGNTDTATGEVTVTAAATTAVRASRHQPQKKTLYLSPGETRIVSQEWAGECEERDTEVVSSEWSATDGGSLTGASLTGTLASVTYSPRGHLAALTNTVTLGNGEVLRAWRWVEAER